MSFEHIISGYIRSQIETKFNIQCPIDIVSSILQFYKLDLSKYEYIATFNSKKSIDLSYLCAFNISSTPKNHLHLYPSSNKTNIFNDSYGSTYKFGVFNKLPLSLRKHLFPEQYAITKDTLHIIFKIEGEGRENKKQHNKIKAYLIETDSMTELPKSNNKTVFDRCGLLLSSQFGIIILGGYDYKKNKSFANVQTLKYSNKKKQLIWDNKMIPPMNNARSNMAHTILNNKYIFVSGGWASSIIGDTNSVEIYNIQTKKWKEISHLRYPRLCHGQLYDRNRNNIFVVGGSRMVQCKSAERYDTEKDIWYVLPNTNYYHTWYPDLKLIDSNVLVVNGDDYIYGGRVRASSGWGVSEYLDLRDSDQKWMCCDNAMMNNKFFGLKLRECDKVHIRGIWSI
eukprot:295461_1